MSGKIDFTTFGDIKYENGFSTTAVTATNTTSAVRTITATFAAGTYLIIGTSSGVKTNGSSCFMGITVDSTTLTEDDGVAYNSTDQMGLTVFRPVTLTAGSHTIRLCIRAASGRTATNVAYAGTSLTVIPLGGLRIL